MAAPRTAALGKILIVSRDRGLLRQLAARLRSDRYAVKTLDSARDTLISLARMRPALLVVDLDSGDGAELLARVQANWPELRVVAIASREPLGDGEVEMNPCVFGRLSRPVDEAELMVIVERAFRLALASDADDDWDAEFITRHPLVVNVLRDARLVAHTDASVLIAGDVGTGKELLAQAIHRASSRKHKPFTVVNCARISETLVEYEALGDENGAFTGAASGLDALFAVAAGSTLLLDGVDAMPAHLQPEMLRLLQKNRPYPGTEGPAEHSDVRIVASTTRDLNALAADGRILEDLAYRLSVVSVRMPALADRRDDIPLLVSHFLDQIAAETGRQRKIFTPEALQLLVAAEWPGNMRQLLSIVRRNVAWSHSPVIDAGPVAKSLGDSVGDATAHTDARDDLMRDYLRQILELSCGRVSRAARLSKRNRMDFFELLARYRLDPQSFRRP